MLSHYLYMCVGQCSSQNFESKGGLVYTIIQMQMTLTPTVIHLGELTFHSLSKGSGVYLFAGLDHWTGLLDS